MFARGPQRLFPKKKQIVCAALLFRPLQPFQSSYVDLSRPCGGDGGVGGQKSLDHPLSAYTHTLHYVQFVKYDDAVSFYDAVSDTIRRKGGKRGIFTEEGVDTVAYFGGNHGSRV